MVVRTSSADLLGVEGRVICIEATMQKSLPRIQITGLPGEIVRESTERVSACLSSMGFDLPTSKILIHLSPASTRKVGSQFDLAIAVSLLAAEGHLIGENISTTGFLGELSLDGRVQRVTGALAMMEILLKQPHIKRVIVPCENRREVRWLPAEKIYPVKSVEEVVEWLMGKRELVRAEGEELRPELPLKCRTLDDVMGQNLARRALQISLAGRHHLLMHGPPGVGKSLIASCSPSLLPAMTHEEAIEVVKNHAHVPQADISLRYRPFRSPHHSASAAAILGGGSGIVVPGEVTLAHNGVLYLDELPEFNRDVIEGLREPLETGQIHLHRIGHALSLSARFTLVAAMNPCPCGYYQSASHQVCVCNVRKIQLYRGKISGPILNRIDLVVYLETPRLEERTSHELGQKEVKAGIEKAVRIQQERYGKAGRNGDQLVNLKEGAFLLEGESRAWFENHLRPGKLNLRSLHKVVKVARTIADIEGGDRIGLEHLQEALAFKCPDTFGRFSA